MLVNFGKTYFSESAPDLWLFLMAALFIGVTMAFPNGLAGLWEEKIKPWWRAKQIERKEVRERVALAQASFPEPPPPRAGAQTNGPTPPLPDGISGQQA
jgi:urea transport system permease protein